MQGSPQSEQNQTPQQELAWRSASDHNVAETRRRFREIAERLPIPRTVIPAMVDAAMEVARFHAMETAYANYELCTGHAYPAEQRESEDAEARAAWRARLARLEPSRHI